jgi:hypothetical protein
MVCKRTENNLHFVSTDMIVPVAEYPAHISRGLAEKSPCMRSLRKVIEKDGLRILSQNN